MKEVDPSLTYNTDLEDAASVWQTGWWRTPPS